MRFQAWFFRLFSVVGIVSAMVSASPARASIEEPTLQEAVGWMKKAILEKNDPMRNRMYFRLRILEQEQKGTVAPALIPLLSDSEEKIAEYAAFVLGWIEDKQAVEPLVKMLASEKEGRIRHAVRALGFMKATEARPAMEALLKNPSPKIRGDAAFALGQLEDPSVLPVLEGFLKTEKDELVRHFTKEGITWIKRYARQ